MKRVVVIINKWWECDAALVPFFDRDSRAADLLPWPDAKDLHHPRRRTNPSTERPPDAIVIPRVTLRLSNLVAEIWCISDLLEHLPDKSIFQSSSWQKAQRLPAVTAAGAAPHCVIAVGTGAMPDPAFTNNGSVVVGTQAFLFDPYSVTPNPHSPWTSAEFGKLLPSAIDADLFRYVTCGLESLQQKFLATGRTADHQRAVICDPRGIAVCSVNITDNSQFAASDVQAVGACKLLTADPVLSVETTHGVIRVAVPGPFLFISGISNRFGRFLDEVGPAGYSQTFPAAHNAGLVLCGLISRLNEYWAPAPASKPLTAP